MRMDQETLDEDAVGDVVGSMLLVAITVLSMGVLAGLVLAMPGPASQLHADFAIRVEPGAGGWGTGDERVTITHQGGEAWAADNARILVAIGGAVTLHEGAALGGGFADGSLKAGESWQLVTLIQPGDLVQVDLVALAENQLVGQHARVAG